MLLTTNLKKELVAIGCVQDENADDDVLAKACGEALATGKLSPARYQELTTSKEAIEFNAKMDRIADGLSKLTEALTAKEAPKSEEKKVEIKEEKKVSDLAKTVAGMGGTPTEPDDKDIDIRVKEAAEMYTDVKSTLRYPDSNKAGRSHPMAGRPVTDFSGGREMNEPSQRDKAVAGAWAKFLCATALKGGSRTLAWMGLPQHDKELLQYAMTNMEWSGASDGGDYADIKQRRLSPREQKDLIDDTVSGGLEAAPIVFDDQILAIPQLNGELYPLVNVISVPRGRRIEGAAVLNVTGSWGGVDATAITLFTTTNYVTAFDTTVYRWEGAIRIGLDFLSDTPINFAQVITQQYGETLLNDLDDVIAVGTGLQPQGVMNKAGVATVAFGATTSLSAYELLLMGIAKQEVKAAPSTLVFCGTQTSYTRALALPVGAADNRRLSGMGNVGGQVYQGYSWMGVPYKINNSLANSQIFCAVLGKYRMYRREGLTIKTSTEGDTLTRANEMLLVAMARFGGQLERAACATLTTTALA